ncbi:oligoribonuclease [Pseudoxanthomonas sp. NC8]|nr:oligoribonuclease [Pseudoxanthomonas sp. NC8]
MAIAAGQDRLIWIDLEMTGLDTGADSILEIATVVTDSQLQVLAEGPELAIAHPLSALEAMDEWNRNQHGRSGLWQRVLDSDVTLPGRGAYRRLPQPVGAGEGVADVRKFDLWDRRFLHRQMPRLEQYFHYRNLDVSTLKELARRWAPDVLAGVHKQSAHTALSDVHDSIAELRHYRRHLTCKAGGGGVGRWGFTAGSATGRKGKARLAVGLSHSSSRGSAGFALGQPQPGVDHGVGVE